MSIEIFITRKTVLVMRKHNFVMILVLVLIVSQFRLFYNLQKLPCLMSLHNLYKSNEYIMQYFTLIDFTMS